MKLLLSAVIISLGSAALAAESVYTSVQPQSCVVIDGASLDADPEIDYATIECPGLGGYRVIISGGDLRYALSLSYNGKEISGERPMSFHNMGSSQVEWRFERVARNSDGERSIRYTALIYRLNYADGNVDASDDKSMLVVMRLNKEKSCLLGTIAQSSDMNKKARALADNTQAKCK